VKETIAPELAATRPLTRRYPVNPTIAEEPAMFARKTEGWDIIRARTI